MFFCNNITASDEVHFTNFDLYSFDNPIEVSQIGIAGDTDLLQLAANALTVNGNLVVDNNSIQVTTAKTPTSSYDTGNEGEFAWDSDYVYVCVATNTWKRSTLTLWGLPAETVIYAGEDVIYAGEDVVYP